MGSRQLFNAFAMENKEIRRINMLALADEHGGLQGLATKTGVDAKYLSQVKNRWKRPGKTKTITGMGDDVARRIEDALGKPRGWMDTIQTGVTFGSTRVAARVEEPAATYDEDRARDAREGIVLHLYRGLFSLQQERLIAGLRALFDANQITRKELGNAELRGVSDDDVRQAFGDAPFHRMQRLKRKEDAPGRDPGTPLDDFLGEP